ncbi:hypothetical protein BDZ89DRAFT_1144166 [Hymenopellis radicata]|nr:hypothetical protein BDZ89DRAFT_1144166 [Hymenopellis radicata]
MKQRLALPLATGSDSRESPDVHGRADIVLTSPKLCQSYRYMETTGEPSDILSRISVGCLQCEDEATSCFALGHRLRQSGNRVKSRLAAERLPWAGNELTSSELSLHGDNWRAIGYIISDIAIVTWRQLASHRIYYLGYVSPAFERVYLPFECLVLMLRLHLVFREEQSAAYNVRMKRPR